MVSEMSGGCRQNCTLLQISDVLLNKKTKWQLSTKYNLSRVVNQWLCEYYTSNRYGGIIYYKSHRDGRTANVAGCCSGKIEFAVSIKTVTKYKNKVVAQVVDDNNNTDGRVVYKVQLDVSYDSDFETPVAVKAAPQQLKRKIVKRVDKTAADMPVAKMIVQQSQLTEMNECMFAEDVIEVAEAMAEAYGM